MTHIEPIWSPDRSECVQGIKQDACEDHSPLLDARMEQVQSWRKAAEAATP